MKHENLTRKIIAAALHVHHTLGGGFLESVYPSSLAYELQLRGIPAVVEKPVDVYYRDIIAGKYFIDLLVDDVVITELKCVERLTMKHIDQVKHYLRATGKDTGLIFNFKHPELEWNRVF